MLGQLRFAGRARVKLDTVVGERLASEVRGSLPVLRIGGWQSLQPGFPEPSVQPSQVETSPRSPRLTQIPQTRNERMPRGVVTRVGSPVRLVRRAGAPFPAARSES